MSVPSDGSAADLLRFAHRLLDETDAIALGYFGSDLAVDAKPDRTLVTQADTGIEELVRARVADGYPGQSVAGEEFGMDADTGNGRWIVDPIDATHNFVRGIEVFATLLAFEREGELELGVVSAPAMGRRWFAVRGEGAHARWNGAERRVHVSGVAALDDAQVIFSTLRGLEEAGLGASLRTLTGQAWRDRGFGDFWGHVLVAQGSAEAMIEYGVKPWDMAAPYVIVTEAGGRMTDLEGRPTWTSPQVVTTNGLLHDTVLRHLAPDR